MCRGLACGAAEPKRVDLFFALVWDTSPQDSYVCGNASVQRAYGEYPSQLHSQLGSILLLRRVLQFMKAATGFPLDRVRGDEKTLLEL